jgi:hypothetical protein
LKTLVYAYGVNELLLRIINLDDRFDGLNNSESVVFDISAFAKELFMEANSQWLIKYNSPKQ